MKKRVIGVGKNEVVPTGISYRVYDLDVHSKRWRCSRFKEKGPSIRKCKVKIAGSGSMYSHASAKESLVLVMAANPEPRDGVVIKDPNRAKAEGYSDRPDVLFPVDAFEA